MSNLIITFLICNTYVHQHQSQDQDDAEGRFWLISKGKSYGGKS